MNNIFFDVNENQPKRELLKVNNLENKLDSNHR